MGTLVCVCVALQDDTHEHSFLLPASLISCLLQFATVNMSNIDWLPFLTHDHFPHLFVENSALSASPSRIQAHTTLKIICVHTSNN